MNYIPRELWLVMMGFLCLGGIILLFDDFRLFRGAMRKGTDFPEKSAIEFRKHLMMMLYSLVYLLPGLLKWLMLVALLNTIMWHFVSYCRRKIEKSRRSRLVERIPTR